MGSRMKQRGHKSVLRVAAKKRRPQISRLCLRCGTAFDTANERRRFCGRTCRRAAYYAANRDRLARHNAAYRAANRKRIARQRAGFRAANRKKLARRSAAYRAAHPFKVARYQAAYRAVHRAELTKYQATYRATMRAGQATIKRHSQVRVSRRRQGR